MLRSLPPIHIIVKGHVTLEGVVAMRR